MDALFDILGTWLAVLLTILVGSYLLRDTFLFRLAQSLLVGTAIGYGSAVILRMVLIEQLIKPLVTDFTGNWPFLLSLVFGLLLLLKLNRNWSASFLSNIGLGILFGVGAALAIGGAVKGVLGPQVGETIFKVLPVSDILGWVNSVLILIGALGALLSFRFAAQENTPLLRLYGQGVRVWGRIGQGFIMIAFGGILANVLTARISALVGQLYFIFHNALGIIK